MMVVALPAFVGAMGLAMDVGNLYLNHRRAQTAVDAAALSGATCQALNPGCTDGSGVATQTATADDPYMTLNPNPVAAPFFDDAYCPSATYKVPCEVTVSATQTVPFYFARLVGVNTGAISVTATAVGGPFNSYSPPGGTGNMMPIGLQYTTPYKDLDSIPLAYKFSSPSSGDSIPGPGDWGYLAIGGSGAAQLTTNIINGAQGTMAIWDGTSTSKTAPSEFVQSEPGVSTGFKDMAKYRTCPGETPTSFSPDSPCAVCIPLVDWTGCTGKCTVPIMGFAEFFITDVTDHGSSGTVSATWIASICRGGRFSPTGSGPVKEGAIAVQLIN